MATVTIRNVWKYYGDTPAVKDLNITCPDGSFVSILGPSGCGKSSTMRMIAGLEHISSGDVLFDDVRVNDLAPKDRDVAMVFENYALYPHKSVYENIANPLRLRGASESTVKERVEGAAKLLEIGHLLGRRPHELSGGQKQRIAIGRAILRDARVLLLDEATSALDAESERAVQAAVEGLAEGRTVLVVAHRLATVKRADRIVVLDGGRIVAEGTHDALVAEGGLYARLARLQFTDGQA